MLSCWDKQQASERSASLLDRRPPFDASRFVIRRNGLPAPGRPFSKGRSVNLIYKGKSLLPMEEKPSSLGQAGPTRSLVLAWHDLEFQLLRDFKLLLLHIENLRVEVPAGVVDTGLVRWRCRAVGAGHTHNPDQKNPTQREVKRPSQSLEGHRQQLLEYYFQERT